MSDHFKDLNQLDQPLIKVKTLQPKLITTIQRSYYKNDLYYYSEYQNERYPFDCQSSFANGNCKGKKTETLNTITPTARQTQYDQWVKKVLMDHSQFQLVQLVREKKIGTEKSRSQGLTTRTHDTSPTYIPGISKANNNLTRNQSLLETSQEKVQDQKDELSKHKAYKYQSQCIKMIFD